MRDIERDMQILEIQIERCAPTKTFILLLLFLLILFLALCF